MLSPSARSRRPGSRTWSFGVKGLGLKIGAKIKTNIIITINDIIVFCYYYYCYCVYIYIYFFCLWVGGREFGIILIHKPPLLRRFGGLGYNQGKEP